MPTKAKDVAGKHCEVCNILMHRKRFKSRIEDYGCFKRRRFCSLRCANSRLKGGTSDTQYRKRARQNVGMLCESCGSNQKLHVHHVDCDPSNNEQSNHQTLCESCHHSWHSRHRQKGLQPMGKMPAGARYSGELCKKAVALKRDNTSV